MTLSWIYNLITRTSEHDSPFIWMRDIWWVPYITLEVSFEVHVAISESPLIYLKSLSDPQYFVEQSCQLDFCHTDLTQTQILFVSSLDDIPIIRLSQSNHQFFSISTYFHFFAILFTCHSNCHSFTWLLWEYIISNIPHWQRWPD